jgi:hypothetical protein
MHWLLCCGIFECGCLIHDFAVLVDNYFLQCIACHLFLSVHRDVKIYLNSDVILECSLVFVRHNSVCCRHVISFVIVSLCLWPREWKRNVEQTAIHAQNEILCELYERSLFRRWRPGPDGSFCQYSGKQTLVGVLNRAAILAFAYSLFMIQT